MYLEINSIKKDGNNISPSEFVLPHKDNFLSILESCLLENPLLELIKGRISAKELRSIKIVINIITEGHCFYFPRRTDFAQVDFVDYFDNKNNSVFIGLHYGMYMGLGVWTIIKLLNEASKPGGNSRLREELSKDDPDSKGIQRVLFHEFGHFIDALDQEFGYSNETYKKIEHVNHHYIFEELWNCYLNRRLQNQLKWKHPYEYGRPFLREAEELLRTIWRSSNAYKFAELYYNALDIYQKYPNACEK
jgi:hypothetical protein